MRVNFTATLIDDNHSYLLKQQRACLALNQIWNTPEFKEAIAQETRTVCTGWWKWKTCKAVKAKTIFSSTSETNDQIYAKLMSVENAVINQDIVYCRNPKVIGYEDGTDVTKVCEGWDDYLDVYGVINNIAHEFCHTLGYHHASAKDYNSVPYKVGNIAEQLARKIRPEL